MTRPPLVMRIRIRNNNTKFGIWLPLFVIFPIVAILVIALAPLALLAALVLLPFGYARTVLCAPALYSVFVAMRGLEVDIVNRRKDESVLVLVK